MWSVELRCGFLKGLGMCIAGLRPFDMPSFAVIWIFQCSALISQAMAPLSKIVTRAQLRSRPLPAVPGFISVTLPTCS